MNENSKYYKLLDILENCFIILTEDRKREMISELIELSNEEGINKIVIREKYMDKFLSKYDNQYIIDKETDIISATHIEENRDSHHFPIYLTTKILTIYNKNKDEIEYINDFEECLYDGKNSIKRVVYNDNNVCVFEAITNNNQYDLFRFLSEDDKLTNIDSHLVSDVTYKDILTDNSKLLHEFELIKNLYKEESKHKVKSIGQIA